MINFIQQRRKIERVVSCQQVQYDKSVCPRRFSEGDLVLLWDQAKEPLVAWKFNPMWHCPYVVK